MTWAEFLAGLNSPSVQLIGPMLSGPIPVREPVIYVDGGTRFRKEGGWSVSVGDGDSGGALDQRLPIEKDYSDLAFCLRHLPPQVQRLQLFGFWGGRRDHEWAVFGEVHRFLASRENSRADIMHDGHAVAIGFRGTLEHSFFGTFSVLTLADAPVRIAGHCRYPFAGVLEAVSSHGLSNEASGPIRLEAEKPVFIFLNEGA